MLQETIEYLPVSKIRSDENIRKTVSEEALEGLMQSMSQVGLLQPVRVRRAADSFLTVDGGMRLLAARKLGWESIAAIVENDERAKAGATQRALISNSQRSDLSPIDAAEGVAKMMRESGVNEAGAAKSLGFSSAKVSGLLSLLTLSDAIRQQIRDGQIPVSSGYELARVKDDPELQAKLAAQIASGTLTRDGLAGAIKARRRPPKARSASGVNRVVVPVGEGRSVSISGGLPSLEALISVCEELLAKARKARTQGWTMPTFLKVARDSVRCTSGA